MSRRRDFPVTVGLIMQFDFLRRNLNYLAVLPDIDWSSQQFVQAHRFLHSATLSFPHARAIFEDFRNVDLVFLAHVTACSLIVFQRIHLQMVHRALNSIGMATKSKQDSCLFSSKRIEYYPLHEHSLL